VRFLLLLPSSESKAPGGEGRWDPGGGWSAGLVAARRQVAEALAASMEDPGTAARITGVKGASHERAVTANRGVLGGPELPASARYRGVVWEHLEAATLPAAATERARRDLLVVSALTGIARYDEPVPDYKLKMSARLDPLGGLGRFWRAPVTAALRQASEAADLVVDLLPGDHARAVAFEELGCPTVRVELTTAAGRAAGHGAKAVKGRLARHLLSSGDDPLGALGSFTWQQWRARPTGDPARFEVTLTP
jgi:uncharacterized protein